jgi:hypothetical protein
MKILLTCLLSLFSFTLTAKETAICTAKVTRLAYHNPDGLYLAIGSSKIFKVCSLKNQFFRTSPESCKMILSIALTAKITGRTLRIYIDNAPTTICADIIAWYRADVRFVELLN